MPKLLLVCCILLVFVSQSINSADKFDVSQLQGFQYRGIIEKFLKIELPKAQAPKEGGITTGAVIILGRYLPPPYEVTVEGSTIYINKVPCTNLRNLLETEENKLRVKLGRIKETAERRLRDVYQRTKWYENKENAEIMLQKECKNLQDYKFVKIERLMSENIKETIILKLYNTTTKQESVGKWKYSEHTLKRISEECEKTNREHSEGLNKSICQGFEIVERPPRVKEKIIVHLWHSETGNFSFEVESDESENAWIMTVGFQIIADEWCEKTLNEKLPRNQIAEEMKNFVSKLPFVKSFEQSGDASWRINGGERQEINGSRCRDENERKPSQDEIDKISNERATKEAENIKKGLKDNTACFFSDFRSYTPLTDELLPSINSIMNKSCSLLEKRDAMKKVLPKQVNFKIQSEFIAVFWKKEGL